MKFPQGVKFGLEIWKPKRRKRHWASYKKERNHCQLGECTDAQLYQSGFNRRNRTTRRMWCVHIHTCACCRICCRDLTAHNCGGWLSSLCKFVIVISHAGCWSLWGRQWRREDGCKLRKKQDKLEATAWAEAHENTSLRASDLELPEEVRTFLLGTKHIYHPRVGKTEGESPGNRNWWAFLFLGITKSLLLLLISLLQPSWLAQDWNGPFNIYLASSPLTLYKSPQTLQWISVCFLV